MLHSRVFITVASHFKIVSVGVRASGARTDKQRQDFNDSTAVPYFPRVSQSTAG